MFWATEPLELNCFGQSLCLNLEIVTVCLLHQSSWQSHLDSRQGIINVLRGLFLFPQVGVVEQFTPPQLLEGSYLTSLFFTRWGLHGYGHWWLGAGAVSEFLLANECVAGAGEQLPGGCLRTDERKKKKKRYAGWLCCCSEKLPSTFVNWVLTARQLAIQMATVHVTDCTIMKSY